MKLGEQQEQVITSSCHEGDATMRRRPERRQAARFDQRILQVAHKLFSERGVERVSMHQIAQEAGIGQGTLYRRYAHKGELILDLLNGSVQCCLQQMQAEGQNPDGGPALQRLDRVVQRCIAFTEEQGSFLVAIMNASPDEKHQMRFSTTYYRTVHSIMARLFEEAVAQDELASLDATYTADALLAALDPALYLFQRHQRGYTPEQIIQRIRCIYMEWGSVGSPLSKARADQPESSLFER